jgi:RNA-directed DNA polymerase
MSSRSHHIRLLAAALTAGPMDNPEAMLIRTRPMVGDLRKARWLKPLVQKISAEFADTPRPSVNTLSGRILEQQAYLKAWSEGRGRISPVPYLSEMAPATGSPQTWKIPEITSIADLAKTLELHTDDLSWLISRGKAEHYHHCWHSKPRTNRFRLIEIPKTLLLDTQRRILRRILDQIPLHDAAQGFRAGHSVRKFVEPHTGKELILRIDLEDFFPSLRSARVLKLFLTAGYPEAVSQALTRLTTHAVPATVLSSRDLTFSEMMRFSERHLPQGAPTSPALANLCAFRLDCRLAGLARSAGAKYTRYADDLLFSGDHDFARQAQRFATKVGAIILEEGLTPNHRKTRIQRQGQRQEAGGLVINEKPNISRHEFDRLKAILNNCLRFGPDSQNHTGLPHFRDHLQGKIAWVNFINPRRGGKLTRIFAQIDWKH